MGGSLNRTSVGLKHSSGGPISHGSLRPQSNQRGIETGFYTQTFAEPIKASIEPAWD